MEKERQYIIIEPRKQIWVAYILWTLNLQYLYYNKFYTWLGYIALPLSSVILMYIGMGDLYFGAISYGLETSIETAGIWFILSLISAAVWFVWWVVSLFMIPTSCAEANKQMALEMHYGKIKI